ncbi:MAG TPA: hypothetical protein VLG67_03405 [Candidatus Saccharimonadales bacterium]|nr:hypothetical protein [Candidatus Saccharimonadales bacterium]
MTEDPLRQVKDIPARQFNIKGRINSWVSQMPDGPIKEKWQKGAFRTKTVDAVKTGVSLAIAAGTREELLDAIPRKLLLDRSKLGSGKAKDELLENLTLQERLSRLMARGNSLTVDDRVKFAVIIAQLELTALGQEGDAKQSLSDRLMAIGAMTTVITRFGLGELQNEKGKKPTPTVIEDPSLTT